MTPPMGRPKTENPIEKVTSVRLDAELDRRLSEYCKKHKVTKGEAVRQGIHLLLAKEKE